MMNQYCRKSLLGMSVVVSILQFVLLPVPHAHAEPAEKTVRVLTIGNSFADNALTYLPQIAEAAGHKVIVGRANLGGCSFERHWNHVAQYEANPDGKEGSPYQSGRKSLKDMLTADDWDFITIQQVSLQSHNLKTYLPYADDLVHYVKEHAPNAQIVVHQTWAYRVDDPRFKPSNQGKEPHTHAVMYEQVRDAYHQFAESHDLDIIPSGDAMFQADTDPKWGYHIDTKFDFDSATAPNLPLQTHSLHTGWFWKKEKDGSDVMRIDGHHASKAGQYLLGCVWFEKFFDESVVENCFVPKGVETDYASFLRKTAHAVTSAQLERVK